MLVGLPAGALQIIFIWIPVIGIRSTNIPRSYWGIGMTVVPIIGNIGIATLPAEKKWPIVVCTWLATLISPVLVIIFALIASNIKGNTKKSAVNNMFYIFYAVAAIVGPQLWSTKESPRFHKGIVTDFVCLGGLIVVFGFFGFYVQNENRNRDREESAVELQCGQVNMDRDLTDNEDRAFRYTA
jgi:ACS family allantoate permease-like MFS transporter